MRSLVALLGCAVLLSLSWGCATHEGASPPLANTDAPPRRSVAGSMPAPESAPSHLDVTGVVTTVVGPIRARAVAILDAAGERRQTRTDEEGGFVIGDVTTPYDLTVMH